MKKLTTVIALFATIALGYAQNCSCESNFEWVKKTFEENDAGFEHIIAKKGQQAYTDHNQRIATKIKDAKDIVTCTDVLYEWLEFFRSGHIDISLSDKIQEQNTATTTKQDFSNWETFKVDVPKFENYLKLKKETDYEGIWFTEPYKIGIKKQGTNYIGFIIESGADTWKKDQVKLKIDTKTQSSTFYMRDHSAIKSNTIELMGSNYLKIGNMLLKRVYPKLPTDEKVEAYLTMLQAKKPYIEQLNSKTLMLRIPSFRQENKATIDSLLASNKALILKTENLIIDIRNGTGGSDASFNELIPYLYTNPIRTVGVQFRSTQLNNQRMLDFINKPEYGFDDEGKKWAQTAYDKLNKNLGKYVGLNTYDVSQTSLDTIYEYPKNIGIIINKGNGSTDEQFLLAAKQSKKVKLFGRTTHGVLDISNMYFVDSPCKEFQLGYALSISKRIPGFVIDEIGIQPDYFMDDDIPEQDWVSQTNDILNN
ncbi:peptidase S41 [Flavobacterium sp. xlx-214]|uniref:S41 family peptidase n=1 Tax=unclassified Flavobacterium TaxID=196869 RepID=UPI0013D87D7B|nr:MULTISPECIES: S41 family peptidase [unclassified Flavobacterium]MBA5791762.1 peptidase S41 [Flavobacterium sp. xlx-221]QMI83001.1 peptidase S41 [Flavobacterium sp. xlx-214]